MEGGIITVPGVPYLYHYPDNYSNVSIHPILCPQFIGRYFSAYNTIDNHNSMRQPDLVLDKYGMIQSGYFRLSTTLAFGVRITYMKLLFYCGVS